MFQLQPQEVFTIVRVLELTDDTDTNYVQAVVTNSKTGVVLKTINLTDQGSRRFTGEYTIPEDVGNEGYYIDISTTIYSDSGYTTNNTNYGEDNKTYQVQQRWNSFFGSGGGVETGSGFQLTGSDVRKQVRKVLKEELKKLKFPEFEQKDVDFSSVLFAINEVLATVQNIPEPEKLDISPTLAEITSLKSELMKAISDKEVTEMPDLQQIIDGNSNENANMSADFKQALRLLLDGRKDRDDKILNFMKQTGDRFDVSDKVRTLLNGDLKPFDKKEETPKKKRLFLNR